MNSDGSHKNFFNNEKKKHTFDKRFKSKGSSNITILIFIIYILF